MKDRRAGRLVELLTPVVALVFTRTVHNPEGWTDLADGRPVGEGLWAGDDSPAPLEHLLNLVPYPPELLRPALANAVLELGNPVMALWFLSAYDDQAADAYANLKTHYPAVPAGPGVAFADIPIPDEDPDDDLDGGEDLDDSRTTISRADEREDQGPRGRAERGPAAHADRRGGPRHRC